MKVQVIKRIGLVVTLFLALFLISSCSNNNAQSSAVGYVNKYGDLLAAYNTNGGRQSKSSWGKRHYCNFGINEGRTYAGLSSATCKTTRTTSRESCYGYYVRKYPDLLSAYNASAGRQSIEAWGRSHYTKLGQFEGRLACSTSPSPTFTFLIFAALVVSFLFVMLSAHYRLNLSLMIISILFGLYLVEGFLVLWGDPDKYINNRSVAAFKAGKLFDYRNGLEVAQDMRKQGVDAYPYVPGSDLRINNWTIDGEPIHPLSSISDVGTVLSNEIGTWSIYQSDRYGFNNPDEVWDSQYIRIAIVGDSYAHGMGDVLEKNSVSLIRNAQTNTLNLGYSGNGPLRELATIREYAKLYEPSIVLWYYFEGNDLFDLKIEKGNTILIRYLKDQSYQQDLLHKQPLINQLLRSLIESKEKVVSAQQIDKLNGAFALRNLARVLKTIAEKKSRSREDAIVADLDNSLVLFAEILQQADKEVRSWGGQLYFVYLPDSKRYIQSSVNTTYRRRDVLARVGHLKIPIVDLVPKFNEQPRPLCLFTLCLEGGHYSREGEEIVSEVILDRLGMNKIQINGSKKVQR